MMTSESTEKSNEFDILISRKSNLQSALPPAPNISSVSVSDEPDATFVAKFVSDLVTQKKHTIQTETISSALRKNWLGKSTRISKPTASPPAERYDEKAMTEHVSKDLLNAKLEATEARMDARVAGMSAKLDATLAEIKADRSRFSRLESDLADANRDLKALPERVDAKLRESASDTKNQIASMKANIWFGVATTVGSVLAALALTFAAFDSGRETSKNISEAAARMERIEAQLKAAAEARSASQPSAAPAVAAVSAASTPRR